MAAATGSGTNTGWGSPAAVAAAASSAHREVDQRTGCVSTSLLGATPLRRRMPSSATARRRAPTASATAIGLPSRTRCRVRPRERFGLRSTRSGAQPASSPDARPTTSSPSSSSATADGIWTPVELEDRHDPPDTIAAVVKVVPKSTASDHSMTDVPPTNLRI